MQSQNSILALDIGGVITEAQDLTCFNELSKEFELPWEKMAACYYDNRAPYDKGLLSPEAYWRKILAFWAKESPEESIKALDEDELAYRYFEWAYTADFLSWSKARPAVRDLAKSLQSQGLRLCLASNMPLTVESHFEEMWPWLLDIPVRLYSAQAKLSKPEPEFFQKLCELNNAEAKDFLFVDDREENVEAAKKFGMQAYHFVEEEETLNFLRNYFKV